MYENQAQPGLKLMLVDDKELSNFILQKQIVKALGRTPQIEEYCDVNQAFERIPKFNPDLIFLDLAVPNFEDGFAFLQKMVDHSYFNSVIVLSSSINDEHHLQVKNYKQVIKFITKPIALEELTEVLRQIKSK